MELTKSQQLYFLLAIAIIGSLAISLQQSFLLTWDVSWLLHTAANLLKGGTYSKDFFEIGPPTNILLYTPAILISKLFSLSIMTAVRIYVFTLGLISLASCYILINKLFNNVKLGLFFLISLEIAYFILPFHDFGQKEHLFFMLVLPYILLIACRVKKIQIDTAATWIGLFAGLGIAIKPYFLIYPLFLELYYAASCKEGLRSSKWLCFIRPETCAIFCVFLFYAAITVIFFRDYLTVVAPYALRWYYASMAASWAALLSQKTVWLSLATSLVYVIQYKHIPYKPLASVFVIAVLAAILSYFLQRTTFSYHIYPIIAFNWLLTVLMLGWYVADGSKTKQTYYLMGVLIATISTCYIIFMKFIPALSILMPYYFFGFFACVLLFMLYFSAGSITSLVAGPFIIVSGGLAIRHLSMATDSYTYTIYVLLFFLTSVFIVYSRRTSINSIHFLISTLLVTLLFMGLFFERTYFYMTRSKIDNASRHLVAFTDQLAEHKSIYFFSSLMEHAHFVDYCRDTTTAMRFTHLWMLPAMTKQADTTTNYKKDKELLIRMITEDLHNKKPHLVFVDVSRHKPFFYSYQDKKWRQFEYLPFFLSENAFAAEWNQYRYLTTVKFGGYMSKIDSDSDRKFAVYQRSD